MKNKFQPTLPALLISVLFALCFFTANVSSVLAEDTSSTLSERIAQGRQIYESGVLISGQPLRGKRSGGISVSGSAAACILCHRRSGMGMAEGANLVPPVTGPVLFENFRQATHRKRLASGMVYRDYPFLSRLAYNDQSLAQAIREGVAQSGHAFQYLMPRYALSDADMQALLAYLHVLSAKSSPGIARRVAHFATAIAPGQDAKRRQAVIDVLQACIAERQPKSQPWQLHVWDLDGQPDTWGRQLELQYAKQPVFAILSGLGNADWAPVQQFCEANHVPCLFPNVDVPGSPEEGVYSFYFSRGVALEAEVAANYLIENADKQGIVRVVQVRTAAGAGTQAAALLRKALAHASISVEERVLSQISPLTVQKAFSDLSKADAAVLWLSDAELAEVMQHAAAPPQSGMLLLSGWLGGLENMPITPAWKKSALMLYPYDAPSRWEVRMNFNLLPWLQSKGIARADERLQGNTLAACNLLSEGMMRLRGVLSRDYLVELIENYPVNMGNAPAPQAFPRFSLGPGQRYSSKGAYVLRFSSPEGKQLEMVHDWITP